MKAKTKKTATRVAVRVEQIKRVSRKLITYTESDWTNLTDDVIPIRGLKGSIVRVTPPHTATEEEIQRLRERLTQSKVAVFRILPKMHGPQVVMKEKEEVKNETARTVVMSMVEESKSQNRDALKEYAESVLSRVGL
jgi:mitochondrial fission protein ELM1